MFCEAIRWLKFRCSLWNILKSFSVRGSTCSKRIHAAMAKKPGYWQGTEKPPPWLPRLSNGIRLWNKPWSVLGGWKSDRQFWGSKPTWGKAKASEFPDNFFPRNSGCFGKSSKLHTWPLNLWVNGRMIKTKRQFSRMFHTAFFAEAVVCLMLVEWLLFVFFLFLWFLVVCCCCSYCYCCCRCCCRCAEIAQIVGCESCL